jgi:hypothetical protein
MEQHDYWPSAMHMGDCDICGNMQDHPLHKRRSQMGSREQEQADDERYIPRSSDRVSRAGAPGNGSASEPGLSVFNAQLGVYMELVQRLLQMTSRVRNAVDVLDGPVPEKAPGGATIDRPPETVAQAWGHLCQATDQLEYQVSRLYR